MSFPYLHQSRKEMVWKGNALIQNKSCIKILNDIQVLSARSVSEFLLPLVKRLLYKVYNFPVLSYNRQRSWDFLEVILLLSRADHRKLFRGYANVTWLCLCECMGSCICCICQVWAWAHARVSWCLQSAEQDCYLWEGVCWTWEHWRV